MSGADQSTSITLNAFEKRLKQALRLYDKPERLGADSPLANTYFLSHTFRDVPRPITLQALGKALRDEIYAAASQLWGGPLPRDRSEMQTKLSEVRQEPESPRYAYVVLELRCFKRYFNSIVRPISGSRAICCLAQSHNIIVSLIWLSNILQRCCLNAYDQRFILSNL